MYVKFFTSIYSGTMRGNSNQLLVFTNLLAHMNRSYIVDMHPQAIADETGLPVAVVRQTLIELESPDPESRTPDHEGRRIARLDEHRAWGWTVLNGEKYRAIRSEEDRAQQNREAQARWRAKQSKPKSNLNKPEKASGKHDKPRSAHAEVDVEVEVEEEVKKDNKSEAQAPSPKFILPAWINREHWDVWHSTAKHRKDTDAQKWLTVAKLEGWKKKGLDYAGALENAAVGGYQGIFLPDERKPKPVVEIDRHPKWVTDAGFGCIEEAENCRCFEHNASQFRDGKKIPVPA